MTALSPRESTCITSTWLNCGLAGFDAPVSGTADVAVQVSGTRAYPLVRSYFHAANAAAYGEPIEQFDSDLNIAIETALNNYSPHA